jgi:hypothetical protein
MAPDNPITRACVHTLTFTLGIIAPIAISYLVYYMWTGETAVIHNLLSNSLPAPFARQISLLTSLTHYWLAGEVIFFFNFWNNRRILQRPSAPITTSKAKRTALFWNCVHTINDIEEWFCGWFYIDDGNNTRASFDQIRRGNVETWYVWSTEPEL